MVFVAEVISFQSGSSNLVTSGELHSRLFCWQYSTPVSQKQLWPVQCRSLLCLIRPAAFPAFVFVVFRCLSARQTGSCLFLLFRFWGWQFIIGVIAAGDAVLLCKGLCAFQMPRAHGNKLLPSAPICSTVDANFLAIVPVAKIPHFITVPPGLFLWIRCVQYTMVFPCGKDSEKKKMPPGGLVPTLRGRFYAPVSFILFQTFSSTIIEIERRCQHETSHCDGCADEGN